MIRIPEDHDWVIFCILGVLFAYVAMFYFLLRENSLRSYLLQSLEDATNSFLCWAIVSAGYVVLLSTLVSQYIPVVPDFISQYQLAGYELNKFGYTLSVFSIFYLGKTVLSYLFYSGVGNSRRWHAFYFTATRFYLVISLVLIILCMAHYYFDIDKHEAFKIYLYFGVSVFIFKIFYYIFHKNKILPIKWYYKFLYICTLQIAPLFALWKVLFI